MDRNSTLAQVAAEIHAVNTKNGFFWTRDQFPTIVALIHSEIDEAFDEIEEKKSGWKLRFAEEIADAAIRVIDCGTQCDFSVAKLIPNIGMDAWADHIERRILTAGNDANYIYVLVDLCKMHSFTSKALECHRKPDDAWESNITYYLLSVLKIAFRMDSREIPIIDQLIAKNETNALRGFKHGGKNY